MTRFLQTSVQVGDVRTEMVVQPFGDRILVLVSQVGKVGQLIQASVPLTTMLHQSDELPSPPAAIQLMPVFGSAPSADMHTLYLLYAAQIATLVWSATQGERRSVVVGIALKPDGEERAHFHTVMTRLHSSLLGLGLE